MTSEFEELEEVAKNYERAYKLIHGKVAKVLLKPALVVDGKEVHHATFRIKVQKTDWHDNGAFTSNHSKAELVAMTDRMLEMR